LKCLRKTIRDESFETGDKKKRKKGNKYRYEVLKLLQTGGGRGQKDDRNGRTTRRMGGVVPSNIKPSAWTGELGTMEKEINPPNESARRHGKLGKIWAGPPMEEEED